MKNKFEQNLFFQIEQIHLEELQDQLPNELLNAKKIKDGEDETFLCPLFDLKCSDQTNIFFLNRLNFQSCSNLESLNFLINNFDNKKKKSFYSEFDFLNISDFFHSIFFIQTNPQPLTMLSKFGWKYLANYFKILNNDGKIFEFDKIFEFLLDEVITFFKQIDEKYILQNFIINFKDDQDKFLIYKIILVDNIIFNFKIIFLDGRIFICVDNNSNQDVFLSKIYLDYTFDIYFYFFNLNNINNKIQL